MKTIYGVVLTAVVASMASTVSAASMSVADAATACKAQAASQYASGEQPARVKFKGVYGGNDSQGTHAGASGRWRQGLPGIL
jgi:hypothetical protein